MSKPILVSSLDSILKHARRVVIAGVMTGTALFAGCAQAGPYADATTVASAPATRPDAIYVYAFDSDASDVRLDDHGLAAKLKASMSGESRAQQQSQEAVEAREEVANEIVAKLQSMGLPAIRADVPPPDDRSVLVVAGSIDRIDAGNRRRRMLIGLGAGESKVGATVQLVYKPAHGVPQLVEQFDASADSGHAPGVAEMAGVGAAAGHAVSSLAVSGGLHAVSETKRAGVSSDEKRLGDAIAAQIGKSGAAQGWMPAKS
ncbi:MULTISPECIES: DUF4410 domain-containing protein [unclassified Caballeronia]|uniref:DUF4410 domain-containing protein n=1 Tax=unclassified Caballeronia TaxID=2646786 RepID=UPI00285E1CDC|nr:MULTISPECIES: DUF4410 domain-containing protein [unclassified Caballeronia]MDR5740758.1 DUF4410 domain-containing protein [Caballeronia sp. LZ016]MDR5808720.1 DUF4410 domain-containing protein [Caballeronia sp. LZ019]